MFKQCQQHLCRFSLSTLPPSAGAISLLSFVLSLPVSLSPSFPPFLFTGYSSLFLFKPPASFSLLHLSPSRPLRMSLPPSLPFPLILSLSLFLCFPLGVMYMCNYYYVVVIHVTLRHVQTRLVRVGKMVVFEYNMYPVYPTG